MKIKPVETPRACSHENKRRFGMWFGPFLIWKPDFSPCERKAVSNQAFNWNGFETRKKGVLDRDSRRKPDSRTCERKALSECDSCVCILEMRAEAMHGAICADCAVGAKYYLAVRRSWSWLGRHFQCMWTHIVQITIPITFWIAIRNVFRNVIRSHVNTATVFELTNLFTIHLVNYVGIKNGGGMRRRLTCLPANMDFHQINIWKVPAEIYDELLTLVLTNPHNKPQVASKWQFKSNYFTR